MTREVFQEVIQVSVDDLDDHPDNHIFLMDEQQLQELAESIAEVGVLQPLLVKDTGDGRFRIVSGHRRKRGAVRAGLTEVPCIAINNELDEGIILVDTNLKVRELTTMEKARAIRYLKQRAGMRQGTRGSLGNGFRGLSELFKDSDRNLRNYDKLNDLISELQDCVERGILGLTAGVRLACLPAYVQEELYRALGDGVRDIGPEEVRKLKEQNDRGYLILEVMEKQIKSMEKELAVHKELQGEKEDLEKEIQSLFAKKKSLEYDLIDHENAVKTLRERAMKKGASLYNLIEEVSRPVAGAKPKIETLLDLPLEAATATHLIKWAKVLIEVGQMVEFAVKQSLETDKTRLQAK